MNEVTTSRRFPHAPTKVWPLVVQFDRWLEPDVRWQIVAAETRRPERVVARLWHTGPTPSTLVEVIVEPDGSDSIVTITESRDRVFDVDASLSGIGVARS